MGGGHDIHQGSIISARMVNEYARANDVAQLNAGWTRWTGTRSAKSIPLYIRHYYRGEHYLRFGAETAFLNWIARKDQHALKAKR